MPDYQTSKIYKLSSPSNNLMYIGSTTQTLAHRLAKHKSAFNFFKNGKGGYLTAFKILECEDYKIELIELFPCNNKEQLCKREGEHIKILDCVNKKIEGRTEEETKEHYKQYKKEYDKQYREAHKEEIKQKDKQYREANKEQLKQYREIHKEEIKQYKKEYREANKEEIKQYKKEYREANKEEIKQYKKEYDKQRKQKKEEIKPVQVIHL